VQLKTHKENILNRPVVNNIQAPSCKIAKFLNKQLHTLLPLPNNYSSYNFIQLAHELTKPHINKTTKLITLDIKDLYKNITVNEVLHIIKTLVNYNNIEKGLSQQIILQLNSVLNQNYFNTIINFINQTKE
jgi:hypothetical protein